jgi:transposase
MRQLVLSEKEKQSIENLHKTSSNSVVRKRCLCILLSNQGNSMAQVAKTVGVSWRTISRLLDKWDAQAPEQKLSALYTAKGQGAKSKLKSVADLLPNLVEKHSRNLKPVLDTLEKEHSITVCKATLQNFLKDTRL